MRSPADARQPSPSSRSQGHSKASSRSPATDRGQQPSPLGPVHWIPSIFSPVLGEDAHPGSSYTSYGAQSVYMAQEQAMGLYSDVDDDDDGDGRKRPQRRLRSDEFYPVHLGGGHRSRRLSGGSTASSIGDGGAARVVSERNSSGLSNVSVSSSQEYGGGGGHYDGAHQNCIDCDMARRHEHGGAPARPNGSIARVRFHEEADEIPTSPPDLLRTSDLHLDQRRHPEDDSSSSRRHGGAPERRHKKRRRHKSSRKRRSSSADRSGDQSPLEEDAAAWEGGGSGGRRTDSAQTHVLTSSVPNSPLTGDHRRANSLDAARVHALNLHRGAPLRHSLPHAHALGVNAHAHHHHAHHHLHQVEPAATRGVPVQLVAPPGGGAAPCGCAPCPVHGMHCAHVGGASLHALGYHDHQQVASLAAGNFYRIQNGKVVMVPKEDEFRSNMAAAAMGGRARGCSSWFRGLFITMWVIIGVVVLAMVTGLILWALMT